MRLYSFSVVTKLSLLELPLRKSLVTWGLLWSVIELELELIQTQMTQKPMLRAEVGMRVRCAKQASIE